MYFSRRYWPEFSYAVISRALGGAALALSSAVVTADDPWPVASVKYDFTTVAAGGATATLDGELKLAATPGGNVLAQDARDGGTRRGLAIGPNFPEEINGSEVLVVTSIPVGSAQGVSGVWLSNLYCGRDGANGGVDCVSSDGEDNNQLKGEQGSVEIEYLDPAAPDGTSCESFHALGTQTLNSTDDMQGDVYVDFGDENGSRVLQMIAATFSTKIPAVAGSCEILGGSGNFQPQVQGNEFSVLGFVLDESELVSECEGNGQSCSAVNIPGLKVEIQNSPSGKYTLANSYYLVDSRAHCDPAAIELASQSSLPAGQPLIVTVNSRFGATTFTVPANMCGIPNQAGIPQIWIQAVVSELDQPYFNPIAEIDVENNPANSDYSCLVDESNPNSGPNDAFMQPLQAWIPRSDQVGGMNRELPVLDADGNLTYVVQDVTTYCDGYGGRSRGLSNLVGNLHYVATAEYPDFNTIISAEIARLEDTVEQTFACLKRGLAQSTLSSGVGRIKKSFDKGKYGQAVQRLDELADDVRGSRLSGPLLNCTADLNTGELYSANTAAQGVIVPALTWGYLLVQIDHLKYQINDKLLGLRVDPPSAN